MTITPDSLRRLADGLANQNAEAERVAARYAASADMLEVLDSIRQYGADTLSGRVDGGPDDRKWQRQAVAEMTRRARIALTKAEEPQP